MTNTAVAIQGKAAMAGKVMKQASEGKITKIIHLSHNDLDGYVPLLETEVAFADTKMELFTRYVGNYDVDREIKEALPFLNEGVLLLMTDISPSEEVAAMIDEAVQNKGQALLLDHHVTAEALNRYDWAYVAKAIDGRLTCGTEMYFKALLAGESLNILLREKQLAELVESVRSFDTWDWKKTNNQTAKDLNAFYFLVQKKHFKERFLAAVLQGQPFYGKEDQLRLDIENQRIEQILYEKLKQMKKLEIDGRLVGVVSVESAHSEVGSHLYENTPELDYVAMLDFVKGSISLRSNTGKEDVEAIAKRFGGGGHPPAAGCGFSPATMELYVVPYLATIQKGSR